MPYIPGLKTLGFTAFIVRRAEQTFVVDIPKDESHWHAAIDVAIWCGQWSHSVFVALILGSGAQSRAHAASCSRLSLTCTMALRPPRPWCISPASYGVCSVREHPERVHPGARFRTYL